MLSYILATSLLIGSWGPSCGPVGPPDNEVLKQQYADQKRATEWQMQRIWSRSREVRLPQEIEETSQKPPVKASVIGPGCEWRFRRDVPSHSYLYRDGVQVGGWDADEKRWLDYDAGTRTWTDGYPPWYSSRNGLVGDDNGNKMFFGVDRDKIEACESLSINGQKVNFRNIQDVFGDDALSDDSGKLRITVCGLKDVRDKVVSDLKTHPGLVLMSSKFLVQSYPPGTWATEVFKRPSGEDFFLSITGAPNKKSQGREYHVQTSYEGPEKLAVAMEGALRRSDPNYDPNKTPDLTKPKPAPAPEPTPPSPAAENGWWVFAAICLILFLGGKRNASP